MSPCLGCGMLCSPGPRCSRCQRTFEEEQYKAKRRELHAVYRTQAWRELSERVRRASTRCTWCLRPLPYRRRIADHVEPLEKRPDLALEPSNVTVSCTSCNTRRGRNWKLPDPNAPEAAPSPSVSVGARMAAILGGEA